MMKKDIDSYLEGSEAIEIPPEEGNVIDIKSRRVTGGPVNPENWLEGLPMLTIFSCRPKDNKNIPQWLLQELQVFYKHERCTMLQQDGKEPFMVHTKDFSECHELVEVFQEIKETDP